MGVKNIVTCNDEINRFLSDYPYERNNGGAIFIHTSIMDKFCERITAYGGNFSDENAWYYNFSIGTVEYKMCLVWTNLDLMIKSKLHMIISESKYSFPWNSNISIYTTLQQFYLVEEFIRKYNLENFVLNIYTDTTRICIHQDIKVAEFTSEITRDLLLPRFRKFLELNDYQFPNSYFATRAFKYLRPHYLAHHNKLYRNQDTFTQVLYVLDYSRNQSKQGNEIFNLFDLIAFKIAIDDNRYVFDNCEFLKLLHKKLKEALEGRSLNLNKYHGNLGILGYSEEVYQYLITQFNSHFDQIKVFDKRETLKINPKRFILNKIDNLLNSSRYYNKLNIHVKNLDEHNSQVLWKIFTYGNLSFRPTLSFDTLNKLEVNDFTTFGDIGDLPSRDFHFKGTNPKHFIENLLNWMKLTMGCRWDNFDLRFIKTEIQSPYVLRDLTVRMIIIKNVKITCKVLRALHTVNYEIIKLSKCYLENDPAIFMLLDGLVGDRYIQINIEEHTLNILMDSIKMVLMTTGRREFRFKNYITIYYLESKFEFIDLCRFKFFINDENTKIEACDLYTNETVNLFDYFYKKEMMDLPTDCHFYE